MYERRAQQGEPGEDEVAGGRPDSGAERWNELSHQEGDQPVEGGAERGGDSLEHTVSESPLDTDLTLASGGINSTLMIQGTGPRPREKKRMKDMRQSSGRSPISSMTSLERVRPSVPVSPATPVRHSSHLSYRKKKTPTPSMEIQVDISDINSRIFLPHFSIRIVEKNVPMT